MAKPDIFLSYNREDSARAKQFADAFAAEGFNVWWDVNLRSGEAYDQVTENALHDAKAVVVLWSPRSVVSRWVRSEAMVADQNDTLIPAMIEPCRRPVMFELVQTADLTHWNGEAKDPEWQEFLAHLRSLIGRPASAPKVPSTAGLDETAPESVLVLPFTNMSGDPEQDYFSDGITEEIITDLSKISALSVVSRHTTFSLKRTSEDIRSIARRTGAKHVLEGSVRKAGARVRISTQLSDANNGHHVWADSYDRDLTDIFEIQESIAKAIAQALRLKLLPEEQQIIEATDTKNVEAYELYLMARQYWISGNDGDPRRDEIILRLCRSAVELDPDYAQAWTLIALTQSLMKFRNSDLPDDGVATARKSLALNAQQAEPHCVLAAALARDGDYEAAVKQLDAAHALDPESWEMHREAGYVHYNFGNMEQALPHFMKASEIMESDFRSGAFATEIYETLGDDANARVAAKRGLAAAKIAVADDPTNSSALALGAAMLCVLDQNETAKEWSRKALMLDPDNLIVRYNIASLHAANLGDTETAFDLLKPWFAAATESELRHIANDPSMASLVDLPEYKEMMADAQQRLSKQNAS